MKKNNFETVVGCFVLLTAMVFALFVYKISTVKVDSYYSLYASFNNIEGINVYSKIKIGGLEIGEVENILMDDNYKILLKLKINKNIKIPSDSSIKISTSGIIGSKYLKLEIGGDDEEMKNGDYFQFTESTMDLEEMITKFMLNKVSNNKK